MDMRYQAFCLADPRFYDSPDRVGRKQGRLTLADTAPPPGWSAAERDGWSHRHPHGIDLPAQGWKLHVSATVADAARVLEVVATYCFEHRLAYKFLPSTSDLVARNMKYADRAGSGKFITVYPPSDESAVQIADALDDLLAGTPGPYVLSDLRWNRGPVYTRYGGFVPRFCVDDRGERVPAIEDPEGNLVPDLREPRFTPPVWVTLPAQMRRHLDALGSGAPPDDFPYAIQEPLHFSNAGGVYLANDLQTGQQVVLKEARPHAGLDRAGQDAIARLRTEARFVEMLADEPAVVGWIGSFDLLEHRFLAEEYVAGRTLNTEMIARYPLIRAEVGPGEIQQYTDWALGVLAQVEAALGRLHARGVVFGDLHPNNMIVTTDDRVVLIDLEMAHETHEDQLPQMGAPGYVPTDNRGGPARDRYGLGCLRLAMFFPLTTVLPLDPGKLDQYLGIVERAFPVPDDFRTTVLADLGLEETEPQQEARCPERALIDKWGADRATPTDLLISHLAAGITHDSTPERRDRLHPGDIAQFTENGLGLAHGAAGVLLTLHRAGVRLPAEHVAWFSSACLSPDRFGPHIGLYDGVAGAALALLELGLPDEAELLAQRMLRSDLSACSDDLYGGLAGLGLAHLALADATGDSRHRDRALDAGRLLRERSRRSPERRTRVSAPGNWAGLMRGRSGHALLHTALYEATGDDQQLDAGLAAVRFDLMSCVRVPADGSLQVDEGWRVLPYLASGSAGIGLATLHLRRHVDDPELERALTDIHRAATPRFIIGPGLLNGRAGLVEYLLSARDAGIDDPLHDELVARHVRDLSWHATTGRTGIAVMGDQLLRLSHDLGSGTAGIIHVLQRAAAPPQPLVGVLPLLGHRAPATSNCRKEVTR